MVRKGGFDREHPRTSVKCSASLKASPARPPRSTRYFAVVSRSLAFRLLSGRKQCGINLLLAGHGPNSGDESAGPFFLPKSTGKIDSSLCSLNHGDHAEFGRSGRERPPDCRLRRNPQIKSRVASSESLEILAFLDGLIAERGRPTQVDAPQTAPRMR